MRIRVARSLAVASAFAMTFAGLSAVADASGPATKQEAIEEGHPAGSAEAVGPPKTVTYKGKRISEDEAASEGLACLTQTDGSLSCYEDLAALQKSRATKSARKVTSSKRRRPRAQAAGCAGGYDLLYVFQYRNYNGYTNVLELRGAWYDLGKISNDVSSYRIGVTGGHMSDYYGGGGYWYPGNTSSCGYGSIPYHYPSWDQRISSRYRS